MMRLALGTLRQHRGAYLGTFVAAILAVGLFSGSGLLLFSALTATPPADRFAGVDLVVAGDREVTVRTVEEKKDKTKTKVKSERLTGAGTLPEDLPASLTDRPEIAEAVPDFAFPVGLATAAGQPVHGADQAPVIGHGWESARLTPYTLRAGSPPAPGAAVVDADLAVRAGVSIGDQMVITSKTGVHPIRVAGIAAPDGPSQPTRDALPGQAALFLAADDVPVVSGLPGPTAVGVLGAPDVDSAALHGAVSALVGEATVLAGADRVRADLPGALPDYVGPISIFGFVIGITAFAAGFVLTGTVALAVRQRLREFALLRTAGATPGQLRRLLGRESVVLAAVAAVPGIPLGVLIASLVAARFQVIGTVPAQFEVRISAPVLIAAGLAGVLVAFVAARVAGRRAVRIAPTQALTETAAAPAGAAAPRVLLAAVLVAGAVGLLTFVPLDGPLGMGMSFNAAALLLCAVAALGPVLVAPMTAVVSRLGRVGGVAGWLAGAVTRTEARRVTAVAVPLVLMFAINATMLLNGALLGQLTAQEQAARTSVATVQVTSPTGIPLDTARRLVALPELTGAAATLPTRAVVTGGGKPKGYAAHGLLSAGSQPALALAVTEGEFGGDDTFAASRYLAGQYGWRVGDEVKIWLADGHQTQLRLTAIYERSRGFGDLVLPAPLVAAHDPRGLVNTVALRYPGDAAAVVADQIRDSGPALRITETASATPAAGKSEQQGAWELMVVISLGFTAIAVINTFAIAAAGRRREYADLRLAGATAGQVHRSAAHEAAITVVVGLLLGCAVTAIVVGAFSTAQDGTFRLIVDPVIYAGMLAGVAGLGLLAGALPVRFVVRRKSSPILDEGR